MGRYLASGDTVTPFINTTVKIINGTCGALSISSTGVWTNMVGTTSVSFNKLNSGTYTNLIIDIRTGFRCGTPAPTHARVGVLVNGVDYELCRLECSNANLVDAHLSMSGTGPITGLAAGTYVVQARMMRGGGTGNVVTDSTDTMSMKVTEEQV
jgi:VCBS repeat-containing protein